MTEKISGPSLLLMLAVFCSCASNLHSLASIQQKDDLQKSLLGKQVVIHQQNDVLVSGMLSEVTDDSTYVRLDRKTGATRALANAEIRFIELQRSGSPAVVGAVVGVFVLLYFITPNYAVAGS